MWAEDDDEISCPFYISIPTGSFSQSSLLYDVLMYHVQNLYKARNMLHAIEARSGVGVVRDEWMDKDAGLNKVSWWSIWKNSEWDGERERKGGKKEGRNDGHVFVCGKKRNKGKE